MDENKDVTPDSSPDTVNPPQEESTSESEKTPVSEPEQKTEEKTVPYARFKEVVDENTKLKKQPPKIINRNLDVEDFIDISTSLEGLDGREKTYAAEQHKLSGKPLKDIIKDENFLLWQSAYRAKVEKEKSNLIPSSKQPDSDMPISFEQALSEATPEEKEKLLADHLGYQFKPRSRADKVIIGR